MSIEKELRLDNLVNCQKNDGSGLMIVEVKALSVSEYPDGIGKAVGIPLTEEWLLKFGFEQDGISFRLKQIGLTFHTAKPTTYVRHVNGGISTFAQITNQPEFVHQLQNLYFVLTGQELEIK